MTKAAAVRPAANCALPARLLTLTSAAAATPSASVDAPIRIVSAPQMMNRTPSEIDVEARGARCHRRRSWKGKRSSATTIVTSTRMAGACGGRTRKRRRAPSATPGGTGTRSTELIETSPRAAARDARLGPGFAAAAADADRCPQRHARAGRSVPMSVATRQRHLGPQQSRRVAVAVGQKRVADALDERTDRRKIDRDLVGETDRISQALSANHRSRSSACQGDGRRRYRHGVHEPTRRECPLCGGTMRLKRTRNSRARIPAIRGRRHASRRMGLPRLRLLRRSRRTRSVGRQALRQRAPIVSRTSLRRVSSNSSNFSADSHSSHSTSSTAGRLSSDTSTRPLRDGRRAFAAS